jgi:hypothetical protein
MISGSDDEVGFDMRGWVEGANRSMDRWVDEQINACFMDEWMDDSMNECVGV